MFWPFNNWNSVAKEGCLETKEANIVADAISKINGWCSRFIVWSFQLTQAKAIAIQKTLLAIICCTRMQKSELPNFTTSLECVVSQLTVFLGQWPKDQAVLFIHSFNCYSTTFALLVYFLFFKQFLFIYLCFACVGSSLLHTGFL